MKIFTIITLLISSSLISVYSQVQSGPGGVGSATDLKIWLDANSLTLANGTGVSSFTDKSGNGNNFIQSNSGKRPIFQTVSTMNSRPAVSFDGVDDFLQSGSIAALTTQNTTWYTAHSTVSKPSSIQYVFSSSHAGGNTSAYKLLNNSGYLSNGNFQVRSYEAVAPFSVTFNSTYSTGVQVFGGVRSATTFVGYRNGAIFGTFARPMLDATVHEFTRIGSYSASSKFYFNGLIGEVIVYTKTLNETQNIIVSNYLSTKYAKTMAANDKYSFEGTHDEELAGIGRVASGDEHLVARGSDIVQVTSASLDDGEFFFWANDGVDLTDIATNVPTDYTLTSPVGSRFNRSWRVEEVGETGTLKIRFDLTVYGFSPTSDYELLIDTDNDGDFSNSVRHTGVFSGTFVTFTIAGTDISNGNWFTLGNPEEPIESIVSGQDWSNPTTWNCGCVPDVTNDVNILSGHSVIVSDTRGVSTLTVDAGGELVLTSSGIFNVEEALDLRGDSDFDIESVVRFNGAVEQNASTVTAVDFGNLTVNNLFGMTFSAGSWNIRGLYRPDAGAVDLAGSVFTFISTAAQTARIGVFGPTASIVGIARVQRYVAPGDANNRNLTTPFGADFKLREWDDELPISGVGFPDGCSPAPGGCYYSARTWVPATGAYDPITDLDAVITSGKGIEIFLGDNLNVLSAKTLTSQGTLSNNSSVALSIQSQWNLIGNPFMCPIDFNDVTRGAGIGNYYYVLNPNTNAFEWYDGSNNTSSVVSLADGKIASHQGFWVFKSSGGSTNMTFDQGSKDTIIADNFMKSNISDLPSEFFKIQLSSLDRKYLATTVIKRGDKFLAEMDDNDLPKFPFEQENVISLYTKTKDGNDVVVNSIGSDDDCMIIPLYFDAPIDGEYTLSLANIPFEYEVDLYDRVEKTFVKLNLTDDAVIFDQEIAEGVHRFDIRITKSASCAPITIEEATSVLVYSTNADIIVEIEENERSLVMQVIGLSGQIIAQYPNVNSDYFRVNSNLETGIYLVNVIDPITKSIVKSEKVFINR